MPMFLYIQHKCGQVHRASHSDVLEDEININSHEVCARLSVYFALHFLVLLVLPEASTKNIILFNLYIPNVYGNPVLEIPT